MWAAAIPAAITAASSIFGGIMGQKNQEKQQQQAYENQKEFAQSGIQWKVEDAKKAGIHPLYALGANTHSFASQISGSNPMAEGISNAGQNVSRALMSTQSKTTQFSAAAEALTLQKMGLENQLLSKQVQNMSLTGPGIPTDNGNLHLLPGQGNSIDPNAAVKDIPLSRIAHDPMGPHQEAASISDVGHAKTASGGWAPVPSKDVKERIEDMTLMELQWALRNQIMPTFGGNFSPPSMPLDKEKVWVYDPMNNEYVQQFPWQMRENVRKGNRGVWRR